MSIEVVSSLALFDMWVCVVGLGLLWVFWSIDFLFMDSDIFLFVNCDDFR